MTHPTIAIIGAGNMGSSLISGLCKNGHPAHALYAADPSLEKLSYLEKTFGIHIITDNHEAVSHAQIVIFAIKPQVFSQIAQDLKTTIHAHRPLVISIAAGINESSIQAWLGGKIAIVRAMPNTPALIGSGASALHANEYVTDEQRNQAESILRAVGITTWLQDESLLNVVTALSGSGPAYFFYMMESLQAAAEEFGLPQEQARLLTLQTALGAARMALESGTPLETLRQHVTSPGGTTEKAITVLEDHHLRSIYKNAIEAAKQRSEELADLFSSSQPVG